MSPAEKLRQDAMQSAARVLHLIEEAWLTEAPPGARPGIERACREVVPPLLRALDSVPPETWALVLDFLAAAARSETYISPAAVEALPMHRIAAELAPLVPGGQR